MPMNANGWGLYYFRIFKAALDELEAAVTQLAQDDPRGYKTHPRSKLLASVYKAITEVVPANPDAPEFRLGKTLEADNTNWRRVKFDARARCRLFFRFTKKPSKVLVFVWMDDPNPGGALDQTLSMFEAFRQMLGQGRVPPNICAVLDWRRK